MKIARRAIHRSVAGAGGEHWLPQDVDHELLAHGQREGDQGQGNDRGACYPASQRDLQCEPTSSREAYCCPEHHEGRGGYRQWSEGVV